MSEEENPRESRPAAGPDAVDEQMDRLRAALAEAQQRVKPLIKLEREGEQVSSDLLNLRLKFYGGP